jgi:hypothetical protein
MVLCSVRRPVTTLKCALLKDSRARDQFSSLPVSVGKTLPHCHMQVVIPAFCLFSCILPQTPKAGSGPKNQCVPPLV